MWNNEFLSNYKTNLHLTANDFKVNIGHGTTYELIYAIILVADMCSLEKKTSKHVRKSFFLSYLHMKI